jgi:integrase
LDSATSRSRASSTIRQKSQVLRELADLLDKDGRPLVTRTSDLTDETIEAWIAAFPTRSVPTVKSHLRALRFMTRRAKKRGWLRVDPFADEPVSAWIRDDSRPSPPRRAMSKAPSDIRRLLDQAAREKRGGSWIAWRDWAYFNALFLTGGRPGEIQRFEVCDFNPRFRTLEIHAKWIPGRAGKLTWWKPKTVGSAATLPIGPELVAVLQAWLIRRPRVLRRRDDCTFLFPGERWQGPWTSGGKGVRPLDRLKALALRAGIGETWQYSARKSIGTHQDIGLTPQGRRRLFRHADELIGDFYDEQEVEARRADANKIERFYLHGT